MVFRMSDSSSSRFRQFLILNFSFLIGFSGCSPNYKADVDAMVLQPAAEFNADSAYSQIANQVNFGPRIPGTDTHTQCGNYLVETLNRYGAQVMEQLDSVTVAAGKRIPMRNIIGSFSPEKKKRILLVAHWDSRPTSDQDPEHFNEPIDGAHDGASGVGVEISPYCVIASKLNIIRAGLSKDIKVHLGDFKKVEGELQKADVVYLYLLESGLKKIEPWFFRNLKKGARVVSMSFKFTEHEPAKIIETKNLGRNTQVRLYLN